MPDELVFNGLNAATGQYLTPPMPARALSDFAQGKPPESGDLRELNQKRDLVLQQRGDPSKQKWALKEGHDPKDLAQAGWGVIFAAQDEKATAALKEALQPLLDHRRAQATLKKEHYYREFIGPKQGVAPKEDKRAFLARHGVGTSGAADPEKAPYYLLIAGAPDAVSYRFQYQLDVQYAVGRVYFDRLEDYRRYAEQVVALEQRGRFLPPRAAFFGPANLNDRATQLSADKLIKPLAASTAQDQPGWEITTLAPAESTKARLTELLRSAPALLLAASHGAAFPLGDARQRAHQGALVCQDWPGPRPGKADAPIPAEQYFAADDLDSTVDLAGRLAILFACYGGGTPRDDDFWQLSGGRAQIAPEGFVAGLPSRMLLQGALAVVAHVDRAWGASFADGNRPQPVTFQSTLKRLMEDHPVGSAMEYFNGRYAEIASDLAAYIDEHQGLDLDDDVVANLWTANNDARNYVVLGDPAARLPVAPPGTTPAAAPAARSAPATLTSAPAAAPAADPELNAALGRVLEKLAGLTEVSQAQAHASGLTAAAKRAGRPVKVEITVRVTDA